MNKKIFIEKLAPKLNVNQDEARIILNGVLEVCAEIFHEYKTLRLVGFGTFHKKDRKARLGRNPKTGEPVDIPERTVVTFKASELLEKSINDNAE